VPTTAARDTCKITGAAAVSRAFGGSVLTETSGVSGTGSTTCRFAVRATNVGTSVTLQMSLTTRESADVFARVKAQPATQNVNGVGRDAFYVPRSRTLQFIVHRTVVAMSATAGAGHLSSTRATRLRADLIALGKVVAAQQ
jgi:hypothetical protein